MDKAHKYTDKQLAKLENEIEQVYNKALKELNKQLEKTLIKINLNKDPNKLYAQLAKEKRLRVLISNLTEELSRANKIAIQIMNNELIDVYGYNHDYEAYSIENLSGADLSFTLLNNQVIKTILEEESNAFALIAIDDLTDKADIIRKLKREVLSGLLIGESITDISKRIEKITNKKKNDSIRIARTETTRIQNNARLDAMKHAEKKGLDISKRWLATMDARTRSSHQHVNGEIVRMNESFSNGLEFPGDPNGNPREVANCRCTMTTEFNGFEKTKEELKLDEDLKKMSFEEWQERKKKGD